jgi:hypothetical protein
MFRGYNFEKETCSQKGLLYIDIGVDTVAGETGNSRALSSEIGPFYKFSFRFLKCLLVVHFEYFLLYYFQSIHNNFSKW